MDVGSTHDTSEFGPMPAAARRSATRVDSCRNSAHVMRRPSSSTRSVRSGLALARASEQIDQCGTGRIGSSAARAHRRSRVMWLLSPVVPPEPRPQLAQRLFERGPLHGPALRPQLEVDRLDSASAPNSMPSACPSSPPSTRRPARRPVGPGAPPRRAIRSAGTHRQTKPRAAAASPSSTSPHRVMAAAA